MPTVQRKTQPGSTRTTAVGAVRPSPDLFAGEAQASGQLAEAVGDLATPIAKLFQVQAAEETANAGLEFDTFLTQQQTDLESDVNYSDHKQTFESKFDAFTTNKLAQIKNSKARDNVKRNAQHLRNVYSRKVQNRAAGRLIKQVNDTVKFKLEGWAEREVKATRPGEVDQIDLEMDKHFNDMKDAGVWTDDQVDMFIDDYRNLVGGKAFEAELTQRAIDDGFEAAAKWGNAAGRAGEFGLDITDTESIVNIFESRATKNAAQAKEQLEAQQESDYEAWWDSRRNGQLNNTALLDESSLDAKTKVALDRMDKADADQILDDAKVQTDTITNIQVRGLIDSIATGDMTFNEALVKYAELSPKIDKDVDEPKFLDRMFAARDQLRTAETADLVKRNTETLQGRERYVRSAIGRAIPEVIAALDPKLKPQLADELANEMAELAVIELNDSFPDKKAITKELVDAKTNEIVNKFRLSPRALSRAVEQRQVRLEASETDRAAAQQQLIDAYTKKGLLGRATEVRDQALIFGLELPEPTKPTVEEAETKTSALSELLKVFKE